MGETYDLQPTTQAQYSVTDSNVVSVDTNGLATALNAGKATITAINGDEVAKVNITVKEA